jgi:hypothetical protein
MAMLACLQLEYLRRIEEHEKHDAGHAPEQVRRDIEFGHVGRHGETEERLLPYGSRTCHLFLLLINIRKAFVIPESFATDVVRTWFQSQPTDDPIPIQGAEEQMRYSMPLHMV